MHCDVLSGHSSTAMTVTASIYFYHSFPNSFQVLQPQAHTGGTARRVLSELTQQMDGCLQTDGKRMPKWAGSKSHPSPACHPQETTSSFLGTHDRRTIPNLCCRSAVKTLSWLETASDPQDLKATNRPIPQWICPIPFWTASPFWPRISQYWDHPTSQKYRMCLVCRFLAA